MANKIIKLKSDDYLKQDATFWKEYREQLYQILFFEEEKLEKTPENIYKKAKEIGIKPTARYFNIQPCQVRYYIKKIEKNSN